MNADSIQFVETDETSQPIPALSGITVFMGVTERGPINDPKDILYSWEDFKRIFGNLIDTSDFPLICKRALDGGSPLRVNRIVHYSDITNPSSITATKASPEDIKLKTPVLPTPSNVVATPSDSGGTLTTGTHQYGVAAVDQFGGVTLASANTSAVIGGSNTGKVDLTWDDIPGAVSYRIYRDGIEYLTSSSNSVSDTGAAGTSGTPPVANTTGESGPAIAKVAPKYAGAVSPTVEITDPSNGLSTQNYFDIKIKVNNQLIEEYRNLRIVGSPTASTADWLKPLKASNLVEFTYEDLSSLPLAATSAAKSVSITFDPTTNGDPIQDTDYIGSPESGLGFHALDAYDDFYQFAVPEISDKDVHNAGAQYASNRGDCEYWAHLDNDSSTVSTLIGEREEISVNTKYLSIFAGGVKFNHPVTGIEMGLSELGDMAAIQAFVDRNYAPWISSANFVRGYVRNITNGVVNNFGPKGKFNQLNQLTQNQINMMIQKDGRIYMSSQVSGQFDDTKASNRNVVRGLIYIKKGLQPILAKYLQEPPTFTTFKAIFNDVEPFLEDMATRRAFSTTATSRGYRWMGDQDASTYEELIVNTKAGLDAGNYKVRLELDFVGVINTITLELALVDNIASVNVIDNNFNV